MTTADDALQALARVLLPYLAAARARADAPFEYATDAPAHYPPRKKKRRAARDAIRAVPGYVKEGKGRATVWRVSVDAYRRHHATPVTALALVPAALTDEQIADEAMASARLRRTRSA